MAPKRRDKKEAGKKRAQSTSGSVNDEIPTCRMNSTGDASGTQTRPAEESSVAEATKVLEEQMDGFESRLETEIKKVPSIGDGSTFKDSYNLLLTTVGHRTRVWRWLSFAKQLEQYNQVMQGFLHLMNQIKDLASKTGAPSIADPMKLIRDEEEKLKKQDTVLTNSWNLAYPQLSPITPNLQAIKDAFREVKEKIDANLGRAVTDSENREGLAIGIQAGMGAGKSHILDIVDKLYPDDQKPLVLKVTYNKNQVLGEEQRTSRTRCQGLLTRIVMSIEKKVPANDYRLIESTLAASDLTISQVAQAVLNKAKGSPIAICIDEIGCLTKDKQELASYLGGLQNLQRQIKRFGDEETSCVVLITALPDVDIRSLSARPLNWLNCRPLSQHEAMSFLQEHNQKLPEPLRLKDDAVQQIQLYCLGHPRSLAVAASSLKGGVPSAKQISSSCQWSTVAEDVEGCIIAHIKAVYLDHDRRKAPIVDAATQLLYDKALLMKSQDGCYQIPPTLLFHPSFKSLEPLQRMFDLTAGQSAAKQLESVQYHFDRFRCQNEWPLNSPGYQIHNGNCLRDVQLVASFKKTEGDKDIFQVVLGESGKKEARLALDSIDLDTYYLPNTSGHPHIESMFSATMHYPSARAGLEERVLILFQSKINKDLSRALNGLKEAARKLVKGELWRETTDSGKPGFLFVVYALDYDVESSNILKDYSGPPLLFVGKNSLDRYFTPTLAGAPQILYDFHQRLNTKQD